MTKQNVVFPRTCSATGAGIFEGYLCEDGEIFKYEADLIQWIKSRQITSKGDEVLSDEFLLNESYNNEEYLWTEWESEEIEVVEPVFVGNSNIIKFMYFANNFPHDWIQKVWSNNEHMTGHITSKWTSLNASNSFGGTLNFFKLFMELDDNNRNILCDWIDSNYGG